MKKSVGNAGREALPRPWKAATACSMDVHNSQGITHIISYSGGSARSLDVGALFKMVSERPGYYEVELVAIDRRHPLRSIPVEKWVSGLERGSGRLLLKREMVRDWTDDPARYHELFERSFRSFHEARIAGRAIRLLAVRQKRRHAELTERLRPLVRVWNRVVEHSVRLADATELIDYVVTVPSIKRYRTSVTSATAISRFSAYAHANITRGRLLSGSERLFECSESAPAGRATLFHKSLTGSGAMRFKNADVWLTPATIFIPMWERIEPLCDAASEHLAHTRKAEVCEETLRKSINSHLLGYRKRSTMVHELELRRLLADN